MAGKSSYKIKYFGFDDLSESDSDDESSQAREKKAKKAAAALAALSSGVDSPHTSDSQDSQASSNTGETILHNTCHSLCRLLVHRLLSPSVLHGSVVSPSAPPLPHWGSQHLCDQRNMNLTVCVLRSGAKGGLSARLQSTLEIMILVCNHSCFYHPRQL